MTTALRATKILDLDGTLCECGIYYDQALAAGAEMLATASGLPTERMLELIQRLDLDAVKLPGHAWGRERFPTSFRAAALAVAALLGMDDEAAQAFGNDLYTVGNSVFSAPYALFDGVTQTLQRDRERGWQLVLYTKGDDEVQERKLELHGLRACFDHVYIVQSKSKEQLLRIVGECDVDIGSSWVIGDSRKDDIAPAQAVGLNTALVEQGTHSWSYNDQEIDPPTVIVSNVRDVPSCIGEYAFGQPARSRVA